MGGEHNIAMGVRKRINPPSRVGSPPRSRKRLGRPGWARVGLGRRNRRQWAMLSWTDLCHHRSVSLVGWARACGVVWCGVGDHALSLSGGWSTTVRAKTSCCYILMLQRSNGTFLTSLSWKRLFGNYGTKCYVGKGHFINGAKFSLGKMFSTIFFKYSIW
jgi:hypothetical protein